MCKRSEKPFPTSCDDFIGFFENAWHNGWLDDYSDEHFLIKCINKQLTGIEWESQLLFNNSTSINTPITDDGKIDYNSFTINFIVNLSAKLMGIRNLFDNKFGHKKAPSTGAVENRSVANVEDEHFLSFEF